MRLFLSALVLAACSSAHAQSACPQFVDVSQAPYSATAFADETAAIKQAVEDVALCGGGTVYLPAFYYVTPQPGQFLGIITLPSGVELRGSGPASSGLIWGDGDWGGGDKYMVFVYQAANAGVSNMTLDGNRHNISSSDEQTHIMVVRESTGVTVDSVEFRDAWSDSIKAFDAAQLVVRDSVFMYAGRIHFCIHTNVDHSQVTGNRADGEFVHFEPGFGSSGILISNNTIVMPETGGYGLVLSGLQHSSIDSNTIMGGSILWMKSADTKLTRNTVVQRPGPYSALGITRDVHRVIIEGNHFENDGAEWTIGMSYGNEVYPKGVQFHNNVVHTKGCSSSLYLYSTVNVSVKGNHFYGKGSANCSNEPVGVAGAPIASELVYDGLYIKDNVFEGYTYAISIGATWQDVINVSAEDNDFRDVLQMYRLETNYGHTITADLE